ncbi:MAG: hypothetical protein ILP14_13755, partial [Oscillospiraceae bacterium]|nr:hypothetical protein [Oscillospiraceae bacterium]
GPAVGGGQDRGRITDHHVPGSPGMEKDTGTVMCIPKILWKQGAEIGSNFRLESMTIIRFYCPSYISFITDFIFILP